MIQQKRPKPKKCAVVTCRAEFVPERMGQKVCSIACSIVFGKKTTEKSLVVQRKIQFHADREKKEKLKSHGEWLRELQKAFNAYIRARDAHLPCISCGKFVQDKANRNAHQYDAGHYRSVGSMSSLRFHEDNVHKQCVVCNRNLHGNLIAYRQGLIARRGIAVVEFLERHDHPVVKWSIPEIKDGIAYYTARTKELQQKKQVELRDISDLILSNSATKKIA